MRKFVILTGLLVAFVATGVIFCTDVTATPKTQPASAARKGFSSHKFSEITDVHANSNYLLYLPSQYDQESSEKWPMIVMLHGSGERGIDPMGLMKFGPFVAAKQQNNFPFIVLGPVCPKNHWWSDSTVTLSVINLIDNIASAYNVDPDRIYLTGYSMGGFGTWDYAIQYPDKFAAIAPICGGGNPYRVKRIKDLPIMIFHGRNDKKVPFWQAQQMAVSLSQIGGNVKFMMYPNTGHYIWQKVYEKQEIYSWFLQQNRKNNLPKSTHHTPPIRKYVPAGRKLNPSRIGTRL